MPRAADPALVGGLPRTHDPLVRINHNPPAVSDLFDVDAFIQMWEDFLNTYLFDIIENVSGIDLSSVEGLVESFSTSFIGLIPGVLGGLTGSAGLGSVFGDLFGLLGSPTGVGGGTPLLPGIGSIPILGGLLSGSTLLGGLIPGLDASKIISGTLDAGLLQPLIDVISLGFGGGSGLDFSSLQSLLSAIPGAGPVLDMFVTSFLGVSGSGFGLPDLANALISIPARFLTGGLIPGQMSNLGVGTVSNVLPELLVNGNFDAASSLIGQGIFQWDGSQGPPGVGTSVYAVADGTLKELFSNAIPVAPAQVLNISGWTKWSGFTGAANSIALTVQKFADGILQSTETIASVASPGASSGWTQLTTSYTVPSGVDTIFLRPVITAAATAGTVWFGKLSVKPTGTTVYTPLIPLLDASKIGSGSFPIGMITNLATMFTGLGTGTSILSQLLGTIPNLTTGLSGLSGLTSVFTDITGILGSPTALGSGTPVLPGVGSIPVIGGLFSGALTFLGSFIPGIDGSKIISGQVSVPLATTVVVPASQIKATATQTITRADTTDASDTGEVSQLFANKIKIVSNVATPTTVNAASWSGIKSVTPMSTNNEYSEVTMSHAAQNGDRVAVILGSNNADQIYANFQFGSVATIFKVTGQTSYANLSVAASGLAQTTATITWAAGDVLRFERTGNVYTIKRNGVAQTLNTGSTYTDNNSSFPFLDYAHRDVGYAEQIAAAGHGVTAFSAGDL